MGHSTTVAHPTIWVCPVCGTESPENTQRCACGYAFAARTLTEPTALPRQRIWVMVLLLFVTAAIYVPCWFLLRRRGINSLNADEKLGVLPFVIAIVLLAVRLALGATGSTEASETVDRLSSVGVLAVNIVLWVQAFKVRRIFEAHLQDANSELSDYPHLRHSESSLSGVAVFFLGIFYLQYVINTRLGPVLTSPRVG
jgi:hypothetical protein